MCFRKSQICTNSRQSILYHNLSLMRMDCGPPRAGHLFPSEALIQAETETEVLPADPELVSRAGSGRMERSDGCLRAHLIQLITSFSIGYIVVLNSQKSHWLTRMVSCD